MATTKTPTPASVAAEAAAAVLEARLVLEQWRTRRAEAEAELGEADAVTGEQLLADPKRAAALPVRMRELRDQVEVSSRTAEAQEQRVRSAERAWLAAQAVLFEVTEVLLARKALQAHQDRTRELLAALEEHDGPYVTQQELALAQRSSSQVLDTEAVEWRLPSSHLLQVDVARAEIRHSVLAAMAKGEDPTVSVVGRSYAGEITEMESYPECVRPGGLVPAPVFQSRAARARALVMDLEALPELLQREIREVEERALREGRRPEDVAAAVERRLVRISQIPDELAVAREQLSSTTAAV